ncbi:DNA endonuclease SmrA [Sansalvadorimonas sp. 2012CJ34-2]|uniref:DNA endonuclease SmrA n=1 Tax=Parendozoicomonas callyspongiae TaxID=2942213 RepID=A0ABT0PJR5_9GAMM|nr:DNA endonuclease SmrA [Sansalvadorimonas sp. 2012CJ34-2]MCL6271630.1 DNA endonuclease SmrA [Sansalvadorimonas sp. 2012CJ34-2]
MVFLPNYKSQHLIAMHTEDIDLFFDEMSGVQPLAPAKRATIKAERKDTPGQEERRRAAAEELIDPNPLSMELRKRLQPHDFLFWKESGVQEGVWKKLCLGKYNMEASLDLHLFTVKEARQELHSFLKSCLENGIRTVLIRHGRGEQGAEKATIKSYTNQWLLEHDHVLAFHTAQKQHGGTAAVYTMIRKNADARNENREQHARRNH